jgi:hypothetical protein
MDITIDTTHPLNDTDRAVLQALLQGQTTPTPASQAPAVGPRPNSAEAIATLVAAGPRKSDGTIAAARRPVADQPGVSFTESTPGDDQDAS